MSSSAQHPGLWIDLASVVAQCDPTIYARALELYRSQKVLTLAIDPQPRYWTLTGDVQGSQRLPYHLTVELRRSVEGRVVEWDSDCTCPVGYQCKHAIALMIKAAYQGNYLLGLRSAAPAVKAPTAQELEAQRQADLAKIQASIALEAENQVIRWLSELERSSQSARPQSTEVRSGKTASARRTDCFLYLLSVANPQGPNPQLSLEVVTAYPKVGGSWSKAKALRYQPESGQAIFDASTEDDRDVLQLMRALPSSSSHYFYAYNLRSKVTVQGKLGLMALEKAANTGRLFVGDAQSQPVRLVTWAPPLPVQWQWHEVPATAGNEGGWVLRPKMDDGHPRLCLNTPPLYLDSHNGRCGLVDMQDMGTGQAAVLLKTPPLQTAALKKHQAQLTQKLGGIALPPVLEPLETLSGITPTPCLHLSLVAPDQVHSDGMILARLRFDYAGHQGWWVGQGTTVLIDDGQSRCMLRRDPQAELDAIIHLRDLDLASDGRGYFGLPGQLPQSRWLQWADQDWAPFKAAGFSLTLDDPLHQWIRRADTVDVSLQQPVDSEGATSPWFDLSLGMEINGVRHNILPWLPDLIDAAARGLIDAETGAPTLPEYVYLPQADGGFVRLPTEPLKPWMTALLELANDSSHDFSGDSLKLTRMDALRTTAALGEGAVWTGAQHLRDLVQQLQGRTELPDVALPASVNATLRPYQQQGVNWLQFLRTYDLAGILADDMGLGKTLQTLAHIQIEKDAGRLTHPALIIAPVSLMGNWRKEAERFCPQLRCLVIHGKDRHEVAGTMAEHDIVIAPYSLLHRDRERWLEATWHILVLDEAQNIKNANTNAAQVAGELKARHRLCLSGTPMENNLGEVWSLFHFLMPGFLGSQRRFGELFRNPIEKQGDPEALRQLRARITPFMLRRTKALVAHELPPKVETVMRVELQGKQADLYETIRLGMEKTVREALSSKGLAKSQITILDALLKLRQVCCDPHLLKLPAAAKVKTSAKLEQLMEGAARDAGRGPQSAVVLAVHQHAHAD